MVKNHVRLMFLPLASSRVKALTISSFLPVPSSTSFSQFTHHLSSVHVYTISVSPPPLFSTQTVPPALIIGSEEVKSCESMKRAEALRGFAKKKMQKIRDYYGSGWVGLVLIRIFFLGKSSQNSPKPVQIFWSSIPCVFCLYNIIHC